MHKISDFLFWSLDMSDKMAASMESPCEMYKRPYLLNCSTDFHKTLLQNIHLFKPFLLKWQLKFVVLSL